MDITTASHNLLAAYGQIAGVAGLQFDADGCARLLFEGQTAVDLEIDIAASCVQLYGVLGPVPAGGREALYRRLLEGNLFGTETGGAALAVDPVREEVLLCRRLDVASTDAYALLPLMEAFAGMVAHWRQLLGSGDLTAEQTAGAAQVPGQMDMMMMRG